MRFVTVLSIVFVSLACRAQETISWHSSVTDSQIKGMVLIAKSDPAPLVVYLSHLSSPRIGKETDGKIVAGLKDSGCNVLVLDYANDPKANGVALCADVLRLRQDLTKKDAPLAIPGVKIDPARIFILPEGYALLRDVEFARDGSRILAMDIAYPANPDVPAPLLMEFSCDNQNRMGTSSLLYCHDALIEGAMLSGFAAAMVDHPVTPPYKGLDDPMPQVIHRAKASVRAARALTQKCNLNGKIGVMGFSRGGPIAAILACSNGQKDLEGSGLHLDQSSDVQAALVHGNRYDYLDLLPEDPMLKRFEKAWGPQKENAEKWASHGAVYYLRDKAAPMFLNTSDAESPEYRDGLLKLARRLEAKQITHVHLEDKDSRGHRVTTDPDILHEIYKFFDLNLKED
jgi:hypothetical protein